VSPSVIRRRREQAGFTLIELMIVVAIIAILAGILIPNFVNARAQAQTSACESNLRSIATAMELAYADNQAYPYGSVPDALTVNNVAYLSASPRDPADPNNGKYTVVQEPSAPTGQGYIVVCPGTHVASTLQNLTSDGTDQQCGANCTAKTIQYTSGIGLTVK
jgi:general secretion pathway protein G